MHRRQLFIIFLLICSGYLQALRADERAESTRGFKNWDKNGDGFLVPLEVPEGPREIFNNVDRNKDGKVTLEEHLLATVGPEEKDKRKVRKPDTSQFKRHVIRQSWDQEKDGYDREYYVSVPEKDKSKIPVLFVFHGGGGQAINMIRGWSRRFSDYLVVSPQGYKKEVGIYLPRRRKLQTPIFSKRLLKISKLNILSLIYQEFQWLGFPMVPAIFFAF